MIVIIMLKLAYEYARANNARFLILFLLEYESTSLTQKK